MTCRWKLNISASPRDDFAVFCLTDRRATARTTDFVEPCSIQTKQNLHFFTVCELGSYPVGHSGPPDICPAPLFLLSFSLDFSVDLLLFHSYSPLFPTNSPFLSPLSWHSSILPVWSFYATPLLAFVTPTPTGVFTSTGSNKMLAGYLVDHSGPLGPRLRSLLLALLYSLPLWSLHAMGIPCGFALP